MLSLSKHPTGLPEANLCDNDLGLSATFRQAQCDNDFGLLATFRQAQCDNENDFCQFEWHAHGGMYREL
ncbi:hypothetical protein ACFO5O_04595 [Geojedonia litorea]|uniref:Uncharacterized protein n=1 Tax=Geojedonia litorea TaxID=1268269 RepID=A0ABV9N1C7_9FLAO